MSLLFYFLTLLVAAAISLAVYMAPTVVAFSRKHHNRVPIAILNVFLGWTMLGWVGALVWSFTSTQAPRRD